VTPQEAVDHVEITQLIHRYGRAIDTRDFAALRQIFTPDAQIAYNVVGGTALELPAMLEFLRGALPMFKLTQHAMGSPVIDLAGDAARATTYLSAAHVQVKLDGEEVYILQHGTYYDRLVRTPQGWRIARRRLENLWTQGEFLTLDRVQPFDRPLTQDGRPIE
jgi:hypothetical protein